MYRKAREHSNWIDQLDVDLASEIRGTMTAVNLSDGETLYHAWSEFKGIYEIVTGKIKLVSLSAEGREVILNLISENRSFGEAPICAGLKQTASSAVAVGDTSLRFMSIKNFNSLRASQPSVNEAVLQRVARRYMAQSSYVMDTSLHPLEFRLGYLLYTYSEENGDADSIVQLTQNDLANMMGVTRQSIHRVMKGWQEDGLITLGYGEIVVHDFQTLLG